MQSICMEKRILPISPSKRIKNLVRTSYSKKVYFNHLKLQLLFAVERCSDIEIHSIIQHMRSEIIIKKLNEPRQETFLNNDTNNQSQVHRLTPV